VAFFALYLMTSEPIKILPTFFHPNVEPTLTFCPEDKFVLIAFLNVVFEAISKTPLTVDGSKIIS